MSLALPAELWIHIFNYAVEDEPLFQHVLPTSLAESTWFKMVYGDWALRAPNESQNLAQRRSYSIKKAIMATCKMWRRLGAEFLFRCLFFNDPTCLQRLRPVLDRKNALGWWAKRLHITRYYAGGGSTMDEMEHALISIIRQCPNLEIFIVNWPISAPTAFIDALCTFCPRVHPFGSASGLTLTLSSLQQLSLSGAFQEFMEQATGWNMPALTTSRSTSSAIAAICRRPGVPLPARHGPDLPRYQLIPVLDVATILDLCPLLSTFAFNLTGASPTGRRALLYAFGVGYAATHSAVDPLTTHLVRRRNDVNFAALNKTNFPRLQRVRVLNRMLLRDLEAANGPDEVGFERWERWWNQCAVQGVRLEDCTGALLGTLPGSEVVVDGEEEDDESEDDEPQDSLLQLRDLLAECRQMSSVIQASRYSRQNTLGRGRR
ncbi:hypothetical protein B0H21DRAFT_706340 [Amylocystis lapponica]|nr:hypothetical protein B0H21DRAFT_706340 [Amylocystis lapponica]